MGIVKMTQVPIPPQLPPGGQVNLDYVRTLNDYVKRLANVISAISKDLDFMLNGHLDANNIRANSIETKNLKAGSITADKIAVGAVTADKIDVNELSAISADLGHITAGRIDAVEMYGSYIYGTEIEGGTITGSTISTRDGSDSKGIVMNSGWADLEIYSGTSSSNIHKTFVIEDLGNDARIWFDRDGIIETSDNIQINADRVDITAPNGVYVNGTKIG